MLQFLGDYKSQRAPFTGSKVMAILLNGLILPIGRVASRRVCTYSLRSRLVSMALEIYYMFCGTSSNSERTQYRARRSIIIWANFFWHLMKVESNTFGLLYFKTELKAKEDKMRRGLIV